MIMKNKIALVTGSNRGIGFAVVKELLKLGIATILTSRDEKAGQNAIEELKSFGDLDYHQLDVADQQSVSNVAQDVASKFGRLDILVNNAGINYDTWQQAIDADLEVVQETMQTNLIGPWRMSKAFIPLMKKNGYGRIVNVSSGAGALKEMSGGTPAYGVSKAALNALTIKLGVELRGSGILANAVCPGWVRTDMGGSEAPRSIEQGAEGIVWAATLPDDGPTGLFFRDKKQISF